MQKIIFGVFKTIIFLVLTFVVILVLFPLVPPFRGYYHTRTVLTGSMEPTIHKGSVIVNKWIKDRDIKQGDIVTFRSPTEANMFITHRVYKIEPAVPLYRFQTKGDANPSADTWHITQAGMEGKVIVTIPYIGYLIEFFKAPWGFAIFIVLPLGIFIVKEALELKRLIQEKRKDKNKNLQKKEQKQKNKAKKVPAVLVFLFISLIFRFLPQATLAVFNSDNVQITGITLQTATSFSGNVVINEVYYDVKSPEKGIEGNNEWVEVYNPTDGAIDISGWKIEDNQGLSHQRTIPSSSPIPSHGYAVITPNASTWSYWLIPGDAIKIVLGNSIGNGLNDNSDRVILKTPGGVEVDAMSYGTDTSAFSPACPDVVTGHSLSRKPAGYDTNTAADWIDTHSGSTPPGPNPGTNPHNKDGSLVVPTTTPEPSVTPTVTLTPTQQEATPTPSPTPTPDVSFYFQNGKLAVGFKADNVSAFEKLNYQISYDTFGGDKGMIGSVNINGEKTIIRENLLLGTCSSLGEVCVYDQGISKLLLHVDLLKSDGSKEELDKELSY